MLVFGLLAITARCGFALADAVLGWLDPDGSQRRSIDFEDDDGKD